MGKNMSLENASKLEIGNPVNQSLPSERGLSLPVSVCSPSVRRARRGQSPPQSIPRAHSILPPFLQLMARTLLPTLASVLGAHAAQCRGPDPQASPPSSALAFPQRWPTLLHWLCSAIISCIYNLKLHLHKKCYL